MLGRLGYSLNEDERPNPEESFNKEEDDLFFNKPDITLRFLLLYRTSAVFFSNTSGLLCFIVDLAIFFFFLSTCGYSETYYDYYSASS